MIHRRTHPTFVEGCWACKAASVGVAAAATPNRRPVPVDIDRRDKTLSKDLAAYKRLRHDGLQPRTINGSYEAEKRVESQYDLTYGRYFTKREYPRVREAVAVSRELGLLTEGGQ